MSQGEKHLYITKLFEPNVIEIKEQYPLDYMLTQQIADEFDVIHPRKHLTGELTVLTTDLLITYRDDNDSEYRVAYAFKYSIGGRNQTRTNQKLKIAEMYWKRFGVRTEQVLRDDVSKRKAHNLLNYINYYNSKLSDSELRKFASALLNDVIEHPSNSLRQSLKAAASSLKVDLPHCMTLFANSLFKHILPIDLEKEIKLHKPLQLCAITECKEV
nr:TnsA endonuclease N-terminal domain-containing protein [Pseudoalteromonas sp. HF66]